MISSSLAIDSRTSRRISRKPSIGDRVRRRARNPRKSKVPACSSRRAAQRSRPVVLELDETGLVETQF